MTDKRVVQVSGIPVSRYKDDLVMDKLLIHFLRKRNGGNGEVDVHYPTRDQGVAMLTFDLVEVADRVLSRRHKLEIEGHSYPLEVSRPQVRGMKFSMPVETVLSLAYFDDISEVRRLLEKHNLIVCGEKRYGLLIEGEFQDVSRCRDELYKTLIKSSFSGRHHTENRPSRRAEYDTKEHSPENDVSKEAHMQKANDKQSRVNSSPDVTLHETSNRNPSPRRTRRTSDSLSAEIVGCNTAGDKKGPPYIKPLLSNNRRPGHSSVDSSQRRPKETSSDHPTSITKHSKINIAANLNFHPAPPKKISVDEDKRPDRNSPMTSNGKPADSSILTSHITSTKFGKDLPESRQPEATFKADSTSSQSKPKSTIGGEFTSNLKHPKSTTGDSTHYNPGQPKNTCADELNSTPKHLKSTIRDSTNFNPVRPKNTSPDELNSKSEDLSTRSAISSSPMAAGGSSSNSPTVNSSTAIHSRNHLDQSSLSTDFLVDPAVHTYIRVFMKDEISDVLRQSNVEMKTETSEGFNKVTLTAKSPDLPQLFYKAVREISEIFSQYQHFLRVQSIDLSNISADVTKKLQLYLFHCGIWSLQNTRRLEMIGPSKYLLEFTEKWTSVRGDFARFIHLIQEGVPPGSSRPPAVGMDNVHHPTTPDHNAAQDAHTQRMRQREHREGSGARGGSRRQNTNSRSKTPSNPPFK